ncbi:MAG: TIM barrel protein [Clostridia bacterium]|nr:TIM barrel protein [Clostridia bacterium]
MKYSICIDSVFHGKDFLDSMKAVKKGGFDTFEFWTWWDKDVALINSLRKELDMQVSTFCVPFISLVDSFRLADYIKGLENSITIAKMLDCKTLITQVGNNIQGLSEDEQKKNLVNGLRTCAPLLEESGIILLFEPLNTLIDHKGYFLSDSGKAFEIHDEVDSPNVKVLFDIYHQLVMGENVMVQIQDNIKRIGHFHAAGYPGRNELDSGSFDYAPLLRIIEGLDYRGYVGIEYIPGGNPAAGLLRLPK